MSLYIKVKDKVKVYSEIDRVIPFEGFVEQVDEVGVTVKNSVVRFYPYTSIYYLEVVKPHMSGFREI